MTLKSEVQKIIIEAIREAQKNKAFPGFELEKNGKSIVIIEKPSENIHGDYATSVALRLAGLLKKDPCDIATQIGDQVLAQKSGIVTKVEVVHPGFLNIFLNDNFVQKQVKNILKEKDKFGSLKPTDAKKKKILVEFIAANPTGQLHLGHGRNSFWGDALSNILVKAGYNTKREYYINDARASNQIKELGKTSVGEGESYLNDYLKSKIKKQNPKLKALIKKIKDKDKLHREAGYLIAGEMQKDNKKFIEKKLKIKFDTWFSEEKELYKKNLVKKMYDWMKSKDFIYEKEGAEWLKLSQFGDSEDRVIVRSDENKTPTYVLPDIAYHANKIQRGFNNLVDVFGADHQGHVKSMKAAMKMIGFGGDLDILIVQMVAINEGGERMKLSKRKGKIVTLESLIDEVGLDSARFFYLSKSLDTQMELDLDLMREQSSKNPVFYVQYAHARIYSILRKSRLKDKNSRLRGLHLEVLSTEYELDLIKSLIRFPELVEEIANDRQVHKLTHYAASLADKFHRFYHECRVIGDDKLLTDARLALIEATAIVLKNTLDLLGVNAPKKM